MPAAMRTSSVPLQQRAGGLRSPRPAVLRPGGPPTAVWREREALVMSTAPAPEAPTAAPSLAPGTPMGDLAASFSETLRRVSDELAAAQEDAERESRDYLVSHRELVEDLSKQQQRMGRVAATAEQLLVDLRSAAAELRRRSAQLRGEINGLRSHSSCRLKEERETREGSLGAIAGKLAKAEEMLTTERQDREVHRTATRNDMAAAIASAIGEESSVRSAMTSEVTEVCSSLQGEARERAQHDARIEASVEDARTCLAGVRVRVDELQRTVEKEGRERLTAQADHDGELGRLQGRLLRLRRDFDMLPMVRQSGAVSPLAAVPRPIGGTHTLLLGSASLQSPGGTTPHDGSRLSPPSPAALADATMALQPVKRLYTSAPATAPVGMPLSAAGILMSPRRVQSPRQQLRAAILPGELGPRVQSPPPSIPATPLLTPRARVVSSKAGVVVDRYVSVVAAEKMNGVEPAA